MPDTNNNTNMLPIQSQEEIYHRLLLSFVPGVGIKMGKALIEQFGTATDIFKAPLKELKRINGITDLKAKGFKDEEVLSNAEKEMAFIIKHDIETLFITDEEYPKRLTNCNDAPLIMFYKGTASLNENKIVAIVGTRKNTDYGQQLCEELIEGLQAQEGLLVVSGLAYGIDATAHKKSVSVGIPTIGVLAHGLDRIYPPVHKNLSNEMLLNGGLLTEFTSANKPEKTNFPMRNRIVAGMSDVTVVVESNKTGGALITAHMASGYNREVAAFPGRVNDNRSAGCNELIRTNIAAMITGADDLLELMNWNTNKKRKLVQKQLFLDLSPEEQKVVDLLQTKDSVHADELFHHTGMANSQLAATLLQLEMQGLIKALPGKHYRMY